jgi:hypothetical protein
MKAALALILFASPLFVTTATAKASSRVLGGAVTEIPNALGQGRPADRTRQRLDLSPPEAQAPPDLGHLRSPKGVRSVGPDLILADADAGPPQAVAAVSVVSGTVGGVIADFSCSQGDRFRLSAIDVEAGAGDQAFAFIGRSGFSGDAGGPRHQVGASTPAISGDVDGVSNLRIALSGQVALGWESFFL